MGSYEVYFSNSGVPATALTGVTFQTLFMASGLTSATLPTITSASGGWYTYSYAVTERMLGVIDGGGGLGDSDRYVPVKLTAEDFYLDRSVASGSTFDAAADEVLADVRKWQGETAVTGVVTGIASDCGNIQDYVTALSGNLDVNVVTWNAATAATGFVQGDRGHAQ